MSVNAGCSSASAAADASTPMIGDSGTWTPTQHASVAKHGSNLLGLMADTISELAAASPGSLLSGTTSTTRSFRRRLPPVHPKTCSYLSKWYCPSDSHSGCTEPRIAVFYWSTLGNESSGQTAGNYITKGTQLQLGALMLNTLIVLLVAVVLVCGGSVQAALPIPKEGLLIRRDRAAAVRRELRLLLDEPVVAGKRSIRTVANQTVKDWPDVKAQIEPHVDEILDLEQDRMRSHRQ